MHSSKHPGEFEVSWPVSTKEETNSNYESRKYYILSPSITRNSDYIWISKECWHKKLLEELADQNREPTSCVFTSISQHSWLQSSMPFAP